MVIYSVAITPLVQRVNGSGTKQVWFADDAAGSCKLKKLRLWWDTLAHPGPAFGYFVNGEKTWLVTKEQHLKDAQKIFHGIGVNITVKKKTLKASVILVGRWGHRCLCLHMLSSKLANG